MRKKVSLAYITNNSERKASYNKRKKGLFKKVSELSTLCDVEACAIIYSPYHPEPEVWPSHDQAQAILTRFYNLSEVEQGRKMENHDSFTRQRLKKAKDQLHRLRGENRLLDLESYMHECIEGTRTLDKTLFLDEAEIKCVINQTLNNIQLRHNAIMAESRRREALLPPPSVEVSTLPQLPPLPPQLPPVPPLPTDVLVPPMEEDNLEGFPWNLVQSPINGLEGDAAGLQDSDFGWAAETAQPNPHIFNPSNSSNDSNSFKYFN